MAKYGNGLSVKQVCKLEIAECKERLSQYEIAEEDVEAITDMISQAYFMLDQSYGVGKNLEETIREECGQEFLDKMIAKSLMSSVSDLMDAIMSDEEEDIEDLPFEDEDDDDDGREWYE